MVSTHNLGFPRIGGKRELKFALEQYWRGELSAQQLAETGKRIRARHWQLQADAAVDWVPVGDFSFYDQILDMSFLLGNIPQRFRLDQQVDDLDGYFSVARGRSSQGKSLQAAELTKWFDTNYHYIVPEFDTGSSFSLQADGLLGQIEEALALGLCVKPVVVGPISYLWLGKSSDRGRAKLELLPRLTRVYGELLDRLAEAGIEWVQFDEPVLALDLPEAWKAGFGSAYKQLYSQRIKTLLTVYFGQLRDNLDLVVNLPVEGIHVDAVRGRDEVAHVIDRLPSSKILSLGIIDGRNVWRGDLNAVLDWLEPAYRQLHDRLWLAPSSSLLHLPIDLEVEMELAPELLAWLAFAKQKLDELHVLRRALNEGRTGVQTQLEENSRALNDRRNSLRVTDDVVQQRLHSITPEMTRRDSSYPVRARKQKARFDLPVFPTTTIGSFPQTQEIRLARQNYRQGKLNESDYKDKMRQEIRRAVEEQESCGLDVLVHGEAERNDMVEYFGEQLSGYAFTRFGWVQSYGSRCVKPPIIYGDVSRSKPITVEWSQYAQSLTERPIKGMLTGPITMLQWAFVRDDQPRSLTAKQIALALRDEVKNLENAGISIIQVDEPAFREGLPLRKADWKNYLDWAVQAFRICTSGVKEDTQVHTHMCYSEFNEIIDAIVALDADVITIETSRSGMELLDAFNNLDYPNEIGPGVYDIHSPNIPTVDEIVTLIEKALANISRDRLWINPDCGLKTRTWREVRAALRHMVEAAERLRNG